MNTTNIHALGGNSDGGEFKAHKWRAEDFNFMKNQPEYMPDNPIRPYMPDAVDTKATNRRNKDNLFLMLAIGVFASIGLVILSVGFVIAKIIEVLR